MRAFRAAALVVALVAGIVAVPVTGAAAATNSGTVVVVPDGTVTTTPFVTVPGHAYRLTVTGVYSYNGRQNLADCGWWNPEWAGDAWFPGAGFRVDGSPADCASQPYTTSHTYTWVEYGTGAPFSFHVSDSNPWDNVGALSVTVVEEWTHPRITASCTALKVRDTEFDTIVVEAVLRISTSGGRGFATADGACRFVGPNGVAATVYASGPGPETVWTDVVLLPLADYDVCVSASAFWALDGSWDSVGHCRPL